jgi:hypothetical protein
MSASQHGSSSAEVRVATILTPAAVRTWLRPSRKHEEVTSRSVRIMRVPRKKAATGGSAIDGRQANPPPICGHAGQ